MKVRRQLFKETVEAHTLDERARAAKARAELEEARARAAKARAEKNAANARSRAISIARDHAGRAARLAAISATPAAAALGYESARPRHRLRSDRQPDFGGSAQSHLDRATRDAMRRETQDLLRNNVLARGMVGRYEDFVVGDGPVVTPASGNGELNRLAGELFELFMDGLDPSRVGRPNLRGGPLSSFTDDLRAIVRQARCTDGDMLAVQAVDEHGLGTIAYVEAERLVNPAHAPGGHFTDSELFCGGVELHPHGGHRAYHVCDYHEVSQRFLQFGTRTIPADKAWFLVNPVGYLQGQVRGEPALQATTQLFELLMGYIHDTAVAAQIHTWIGLIFKSEKPADLDYAMEAGNADQPPGRQPAEPRDIRFGPGWRHICRPNESVEPFNPTQPTEKFREFVLTLTQIIGADLAVPLLLALFVSDGMSFSNLRGVLSLAARNYAYVQDWLGRYVKAVYRWKVSEWIERGLLPAAADAHRVDVMLPPPPVVDFKMEVEGYDFAARNNYMSKTLVSRLLGFGRFDKTAADRGREVALEAKHGVTPEGTPGAKRPGEQGAGR